MSITTVTWEDTTTLCDHCGGRILRRNEGLTNRVCLQCERCRCQWTLENRPLRAGAQPGCKRALAAQSEALYRTSRNRQLAPALLALLLFIAVVLYAGLPTLTQVLPGLLGALAALAVVTLGRDRQWW